MASEKRNTYMIRRISDGKYSTGGFFPVFDNQGQAWPSENHVREHLHNFIRMDGTFKDVYSGCEVVEFRSRINNGYSAPFVLSDEMPTMATETKTAHINAMKRQIANWKATTAQRVKQNQTEIDKLQRKIDALEA